MHLKRMFVVALSLSAIVGMLTATASAQIQGGPKIVVVEPTSPGTMGTHTSNRVEIDFNGALTGVQAILSLTGGQVYNLTQAEFGSDTAPNGALFPLAPNTQWDSFITMGGYAQGGSTLTPLIVGGAVNLDPNAMRQFDTAGVNLAWASPPGMAPTSQTNYSVAQFTLTNDAAGELDLLVSAAGVINTFNLPIVNGIIGGAGPVIPEPSTIILLGMGLVGLVAMKRRTR